MSDTTEAMRAAKLEAAIRKVYAAKGRHHTQIANCEMFELVGLKGYMPGETPAAPAVTDRPHTGAVPELTDAQIDAALRHGSKWDHPGDEVMYLSRKEIKEAIREAVRLAAQPSPERNDCEPVAWRFPKAGMGNGYNYTETMDGEEPRFVPLWQALYTAPPPPAERHYCERCGERLGSTLGVHTCTPPGDDETASVMRRCATIAAIHSMYPVETEWERGYGAGRKAAADAIHAAATKEPHQ